MTINEAGLLMAMGKILDPFREKDLIHAPLEGSGLYPRDVPEGPLVLSSDFWSKVQANESLSLYELETLRVMLEEVWVLGETYSPSKEDDEAVVPLFQMFPLVNPSLDMEWAASKFLSRAAGNNYNEYLLFVAHLLLLRLNARGAELGPWILDNQDAKNVIMYGMFSRLTSTLLLANTYEGFVEALDGATRSLDRKLWIEMMDKIDQDVEGKFDETRVKYGFLSTHERLSSNNLVKKYIPGLFQNYLKSVRTDFVQVYTFYARMIDAVAAQLGLPAQPHPLETIL